jgi:hypothetical protein
VQSACTVFSERVCDKFAQFSGTVQAAGKELKNDSFYLCCHVCTGLPERVCSCFDQLIPYHGIVFFLFFFLSTLLLTSFTVHNLTT